jgi:hypothetical protein
MEDNRESKINELDKKKKEYLDYINNHITNVKKVWDNVRIFLVEAQVTPEIIDIVDRNIPFHDFSKFLSSEFEGYRQFFYPTSEEIRSVDVFNRAWNHHCKHNQHHWEYWIIPEKERNLIFDMPQEMILEMLCDWTAMSLFFKDLPSEFYARKKQEMILSSSTRALTEAWLPVFDRVVKEEVS